MSEKNLDREAQNIRTLTVIGMDRGNAVRSGTTVLKINVTDASDIFSLFLKEIFKVKVNENISINTAEITYKCSKTLGTIHHTGMFTIHPINGDIKVNRHLYFEINKKL